jgi:fengycin family lipopeptide synthetase B
MTASKQLKINTEERKFRAAAAPLPDPIRAARRDCAPIPLSLFQQRLWFLEQLVPGNPAYVIPQEIRFRGKLDGAALQRVLNEVVRRHESLRTRFGAENGRPFQIIDPPAPPALPVEDLRGLPADEREAAAERITVAEAGKPFDLERGPLFRCRLLLLDEEDSILLIMMSHIVADAWSVKVLFNEMRALYQAYLQGLPSPLPELLIQYVDFAVWQDEQMKSGAFESHFSYWHEQLDGLSDLALPTDRPRPPMQSFRGAVQWIKLPESLSRALGLLAQQEGITLYMLLLAAFQVLLHRYTGSEDIPVATPSANRNRPEIEGIVGFFVNTLILRSRCSREMSFRRLARQVRETALNCYTHQELPFDRIVERLRPNRELGRNPLAQVVFGFDSASVASDFGNLSATIRSIDNHTAKFDLFLSLRLKPEGIMGRVEYSTDLFEAATIARMARHLETLLGSIVADPDGSIGRLALLPEQERKQILYDWNRTGSDVAELGLAELFERQVRRTPQAPALWFAGESISYSELDGRANQVARMLRQRGAGEESRIGVCMERSREMVVAVLGILKAGAAYVPLDPAYPKPRLGFMMRDAGLLLTLTQARLKESLPRESGPVLALEEEWAAVAREPETVPPLSAGPDNLAYVIYTSGSTGHPKGVAMTRRCVQTLIPWQIARSHGRPLRTLQFSSFSFDVSLQEILSTLSCGGTLFLIPEDLRRDSSRLWELICQEKIDRVFLPFVALQQLAEAAQASGLAAPELREVISAGEQLQITPAIARLFENLPEAILDNQYGPSESHIISGFQLPARRAEWPALPPIGRPIDGTELYVLDQELEPVPIRVTGEIYIGGDGLARGYMGRPDLTAGKFLPNPFGAPGSRIYKTGDLGRFTPEGDIEFLGRTDHQVKIRGFRIELGEIEMVLGAHPAVQLAVVTATQEAGRDRRLVAYIVAAKDAGVTQRDLRSHIGARLPEYMVPSVFVFLDALPKTPSGKIDRRSLPAAGQQRPELESGFQAPRNPIEELLVIIWRNVLQLQQVGVHDNFFELGGDSILSIQVVTRAVRAGIHITPKQLFQHQTIAELAQMAGEASATASAEQGPVTGEAPLTPVQHWFFEHRFAEQHYWNMSLPLLVRARISAEVMREAVRQIVYRHDALRLRFVRNGDGETWKQTHAPADGPVPFMHHDLSHLPEQEQNAAISKTGEEAQCSLDLSHGPLIRFVFFDLGAAAHACLLIVAHHLVIDGISWRILLEDLETLCEQLGRGDRPELPLKTTSFQRWALRLAQHAREPRVEAEVPYWTSDAHRNAMPIPLDHRNGENLQNSSGSVVLRLDREETAAVLQVVPRAYKVQINDVLLTALSRAFHHWTASPSLLINLEGHGREEIFSDVNVFRTIGWFTAIFPVLLQGPDGRGPVEHLLAVARQLQEIPDKGVNYGVLRYLSPKADIADALRGMPQAEVTFNYLGQFDHVLAKTFSSGLSRYSAGPGQSPRGKRFSLIYVSGLHAEERLEINFNYSENFHRHSTIAALADSLRRELLALAAAGKATAAPDPAADLRRSKISAQDLQKIMTRVQKAR